MDRHLTIALVTYVIVHPLVAIALLSAGLPFVAAEAVALLAGFTAITLVLVLRRTSSARRS